MSALTLPDLVARWKELRDARMECESAAKALAGPESEAANTVLQWLAASGQRAASLPGLGTVASKTNIRVYLTDHKLMAEFMLRRLQDAAERGESLVDHLVLQKAAAQSEMLDWARRGIGPEDDGSDPDVLNRVLNPLGFAAKAVESLHFTKEKSK